jgi:hypothetical protein
MSFDQQPRRVLLWLLDPGVNAPGDGRLRLAQLRSRLLQLAIVSFVLLLLQFPVQIVARPPLPHVAPATDDTVQNGLSVVMALCLIAAVTAICLCVGKGLGITRRRIAVWVALLTVALTVVVDAVALWLALA